MPAVAGQERVLGGRGQEGSGFRGTGQTFDEGDVPQMAGESRKVDGHGFNPRLGTVLGGAPTSI